MNIAHWEIDYARRFGDQIALVTRERSWTNAEMHDSARRLARALINLGVAPGDRVAIALKNSPELFIAASATWLAGGVVVVMADSSPHELVQMVAHCRPAAILARAFPSDAFTTVSLRIQCEASSMTAPGCRQFHQLIEEHAPLAAPVRREPSDVAQLCYTSGSTGMPKAAVFTHGSRHAYWTAVSGLAPSEPSVAIVVTPSSAFGAGLVGLRVALNRRFVLLEAITPEEVLAAVEKYRGAEISLLPTIAEQLLACPRLGEFDCSSLRSINIGGSHVSAQLVSRLKETLGNGDADVRVHYGMTEAGGGVANTSGGGDGLVGAPVPGTEVRIVDGDGAEVPAGSVGEILIRSPFMASGYWEDPAASAGLFRNGFLRTGDMGFVDSQGQICLTGRLKEIVIQGGFNVVTAELVAVIRGLPGVAECAVFGIPNSLLGEEVVACVVRNAGAEVTESEVRSRCASMLDPRKLPCQVIFVEELPKTHSGKVNLRVLKERVLAAATKGSDRPDVANLLTALTARERVAHFERTIANCLIGVFAASGREPVPAVPPDVPFGELGLDSIGAVRLAHALTEQLGLDVSPMLIYSEPTVAALGKALDTRVSRPVAQTSAAGGPHRVVEGSASDANAVAIVGIGCRLPGHVDSPESLWDLLMRGEDATCEVPPGRAIAGSSWRAAFLNGVDRFDAPFFRLGGHAENLDPRHRMVLEVGWEALEDAAQNPLALDAARTGVFLGIYGERYESPDPLGTAPGMAVSYLCQFLNVRGPVMSVDTTCSSSLVALHYAVSSLRSGECDLAIVGGVNLLSKPVGAGALGILATDGRSKSFAADADGFGQGEGCVLFVLKRIAEARAAGDRIYALVRGTAINHDGRSSSLTAPNSVAQGELVTLALRASGVEPDCVQYVEAHGTGTQLGDPIEIDGLARAFGSRSGAALRVGSVKTNMGHLEAAAGAVGVAKVALAITHRQLPASLHCSALNPHIAWDRLPIEVQSAAGSWPAPQAPLIAGVSSFGMSGTNAHAVLSEAPAVSLRDARATADEGPWLLPLSAATPTALRATASAYIEALRRHEVAGTACRDIAFTACCGRAHLGHRIAVVGRNTSEWIDALQRWLTQPDSHPSGASEHTTLEALAEHYCAGHEVDWPQAQVVGARKVALPHYRWDHASYWLPQVPGDSRSSVETTAMQPEAPRSAEELHDIVRQEVAALAQIPIERLLRSDALDSLSLDSLGLDSLAAIRLRERLHARLGARLTADCVAVTSTVGSVVGRFSEAAFAPRPIRWLRRQGRRPTHVWIHPVGGGVSCYEELTHALPFRAAAIPSPSLQTGAPVASSIGHMAETYASILVEEGMDEPHVLAGWSLGGLVAYEMAAKLRAQGRKVPLVIMIDSYMSLDDVKPEAVAEAMPLLGGRGRDLAREFSAEDPTRLAHVFRANLSAARRYRPPPYDGRVLLLRAMSPANPADLVFTSAWPERSSNLEVVEVDADHYSILQPPALGRVLDILSHAS